LSSMSKMLRTVIMLLCSGVKVFADRLKKLSRAKIDRIV
jgi:hypothetical protein